MLSLIESCIVSIRSTYKETIYIGSREYSNVYEYFSWIFHACYMKHFDFHKQEIMRLVYYHYAIEV